MNNTLLGGLALGVAIAGAGAASAEDFNVTIVAGHPPVFRWVKQFDEAFVPTVTAEMEKLGHSFTATGQYGGAIAGVGEELETVEAGLAEIGACSSLFDPAKMALQNVTYYTPFVSDDGRSVAEVMHELHLTDERMTQAYTDNGVVYVGGPSAIDDYLLMTNFPVNSLADLEGRKIAAPGPAINWLSGTGAVGVQGNLTTYYNEIQTGVYDGVIVFASAAFPGKLHEVAPYVTRFGLGAQFAGSICANKDWWDGLDADVQAALRAGADASMEWYLGDLEAFTQMAFAKMGEAGATITDASSEMREEWAAGMDNSAKEWAAANANGPEILAAYMEAMRAKGAEPLRNWDQE
ncbi:C4-dicarboxylate TRAP transporter substrate-binding protein [uncultured Maritimibacter sp.]|uniref:C4-dicarboxylate TRAP transporter substrate-binding protein n=1 Tax=uncultured Maritimibacter sp. TaxID=991866 RepID=UPI000B26532B|nr:C4-dicarboxylate TRAP transporter substrate-binding protein [uncultured Maritimibacter sp.]